MRNATRSKSASSFGFSLIELMITVAIIAILAMIALPSYSEYITRSRLIDAHTRLGDLRIQMEKYFQDNRTYIAGGACGIELTAIADANLDGGRSFDYTCPVGALSATTYTLRADGRAAKNMGSFVFTVTEGNVKASSGPAGWTAAPTCWFVRKNGDCS